MPHQRPFFLRILPTRLQIPVYMRLFNHRQHRWPALFESSSLRFAPTVKMKLIPGDIVAGAIALTGLYELPQTRRVAELSRKGGLMVDVGAHAGYFTLLWLAGNPVNRAIAFEPDPQYFAVLRQNVEDNGLSSRAMLFPFAVGSEADKRHFDLEHLCLSNAPAKSSIEVTVVRLDDVLEPTSHVDFLKIDAEGADTWVIQGAVELLRKGLISELWYEQLTWKMEEFGISPNDAQDFLLKLGYKVKRQGRVTPEMREFQATRP